MPIRNGGAMTLTERSFIRVLIRVLLHQVSVRSQDIVKKTLLLIAVLLTIDSQHHLPVIHHDLVAAMHRVKELLIVNADDVAVADDTSIRDETDLFAFLTCHH